MIDLGFGAAMLGYGDVADVYLKNKEKLEILFKNNREKNREANVSDVKNMFIKIEILGVLAPI